MPNWIATVLSVALGGFLAMLAAWFADKRLTERERVSRREDQRERRIDFQRESLLTLQVASQALFRSAGALNHQDKIAFRQTGVWQAQTLVAGVSDELHLKNTDTMLLSSRILDDKVRSLSDVLRAQVASVAIAKDDKAAENAIQAASKTQQSLINRIGQLVREIDEAV